MLLKSCIFIQKSELIFKAIKVMVHHFRKIGGGLDGHLLSSLVLVNSYFFIGLTLCMNIYINKFLTEL